MKRRFLTIMLLFLLALTGCFTKEPIEVLKKSINVSKEAKSLETDLKIVAKIESEGTKLDLEIPISISYDATNKDNTRLKLEVQENMFTDSFTAYAKLNSKKIEALIPIKLMDMFYQVQTDRTEEVWIFVTEEINLEEIKNEVNEEKIEKINNLDFEKIIGNNFVFVSKDSKLTHYQLIINKEIYDRINKAIEMDMEYTLSNEFIIDIYIDRETYELSKISIDLKEILKGFNSILPIEDVKELKIEIDFKNYNKTNFLLPENINNKITIEEYQNSILED